MSNDHTLPASEPVIRVLIADDHAIVREGMRMLLSRPGFQLVGEAVDGIEAVQQVRALHPDVIVLDLKMPRQTGLETIREIKRDNPDAHILVLTSFDADDQVFPTIKAGAQGYLLKDSPPEQLIQAIRDVYRGESSLHPSIARRVLDEISHPNDLPPAEKPLTARELEVLQLLARGLSNQEIAAQLMIGERTVATHVSNLLNKLHLASRTQAALYAIRTGLAESSLSDPGTHP
jgi:NarL family two-component system response regulator LiaR